METGANSCSCPELFLESDAVEITVAGATDGQPNGNVLADGDLDDILGGGSPSTGSQYDGLTDEDVDDILNGPESGASQGSGGGAAATGSPSENVLSDDEFLDILNG